MLVAVVVVVDGGRSGKKFDAYRSSPPASLRRDVKGKLVAWGVVLLGGYFGEENRVEVVREIG